MLAFKGSHAGDVLAMGGDPVVVLSVGGASFIFGPGVSGLTVLFPLDADLDLAAVGEVVLALVLEDDVTLLSAGAADVGAEYGVVGRFSIHGGLVELASFEGLDVVATAVDVLIVLPGGLNHRGPLCAGEGLALGRHTVELDVLAGLGALVLLGVPVELAGGPFKLAGLGALSRGLGPGVYGVKLLLKEDLGDGCPTEGQQ